MSGQYHTSKAPVIDLFSGQVLGSDNDKRLIRLSPEYDGVSMIYCNDEKPHRLFKLQLIGWGLQLDGKVVGLVPWLNKICACPTLKDPLNGHWEGYFNSANGNIFYESPSHKIIELEAAYIYHCKNTQGDAVKSNNQVIQEIPDHIGTHAVFTHTTEKTLDVKAIFSWQLHANGHIEGMLVNSAKIHNTPVLMGDDALYSATTSADFKYFFQYGVANQIKTKNPATIKAISTLIER